MSDKGFGIASNPQYDGYQQGLASKLNSFLKHNSRDTTNHIGTAITSKDQQLANELHKPIKKRKLYFLFRDKAWGSDLADLLLISKYNKGDRFLLCVIGIFSKYAWVVPLADRKNIAITNAFQKLIDEADRKPNKIWIDQGSLFYNRSLKSWLHDNGIESIKHTRKEDLLLLRDYQDIEE